EGGEGNVVQPLAPGLLVVSGHTSTKHILSVISTAEGKEILREEGTFDFLVHDGIQDLWLMARNNSGNYPAKSGDDVVLETRRFNLKTRKWMQLNPTPVKIPAPVSDALLLRNRIAYISRGKTATSAQATVIDTTKAEST